MSKPLIASSSIKILGFLLMLLLLQTFDVNQLKYLKRFLLKKFHMHLEKLDFMSKNFFVAHVILSIEELGIGLEIFSLIVPGK